MKKNFLTTFLLSGILIASIGGTAYAKTDAYLIKDNANIAYEFNKNELTDSFLKFKSKENSLLFDEYNKMLKENGPYAFHDNTQKYVEYKKVEQAFLDNKLQGKSFILDNFTESSNTKGMSTVAKKLMLVTESGDKIIYREKELTEIGDLEIISIK